MPNNADHLHYYVVGSGRYKRKLVDKAHFMLVLLSGGKVAKNSSYNKEGIVRYEGFKTAGNKFKNRLKGKVYFPYSVIDWNHARANNVITKVRAKNHNKCLQCPPLDVYWNTGETNGTV